MLRRNNKLHPIDAVRVLVVTGEPDPRVLQVAFAVFVAVDFAIRGGAGAGLELDGWPGAGLALTAGLTVLVFAVPWQRLAPQAVTVVPVLDIAALGAIRISQSGSAAGILIVVPALWLGRELGRRGAVVVLAAVAALAAAPSMIVLGTDALAVSRAVLITAVAGWSALAIAYGLERIRSERDEAARRGEELGAAIVAIEEHQRAAAAIFDTVDVGLLLLDREGRATAYNRRLKEFFLFSDPDGSPDRTGDVGPVYGEDGLPLADDETPTARAARGEEFEDRRTWVGADPSARRALSVSARSLRGPDGEFDGAALTYKDVTDLVRVEQALADTTERYRSLFDYNPNAVFSLDLTGRFVSSNAASEQLCGYALEELAALEMGALIVPTRALETAAAFEKAVNRESTRLETAFIHKDGHVVEVNITGVPIVVQGEVVGVHCIAEDITERKRLECELHRSQQAAEQANEAKSFFLANVSHEIRTPLTSLLATTEALTDTDLDAWQTRYVEIIGRSGHRLLSLINDVLDFSKMEAGMARAESRPVDVRAVVAEVAALLSAGAEKKGLELRVTVAPEVPTAVVGDPARMVQVLTNLVDNAVKFTEDGWVHLSASCEGPAGRPTRLTFVVEDSGIGIEAEQQTVVFESFSQADPSITRKYGGTGLGLALCKQLVDLMGGTIGVTSSPRVGSTFTVELPLSAHPDQDTARRPTALPGPVATFVDATNQADDDRFVSAFTPDAHLDDWGRHFHGHDGVRSWDSTDNIGVQAHLEVVEVEEVQPDAEYVVTLTVSGHGHHGTGPMRFRLRDGLIADLEIS